jgi:hypothetical protein
MHHPNNYSTSHWNQQNPMPSIGQPLKTEPSSTLCGCACPCPFMYNMYLKKSSRHFWDRVANIQNGSNKNFGLIKKCIGKLDLIPLNNDYAFLQSKYIIFPFSFGYSWIKHMAQLMWKSIADSQWIKDHSKRVNNWVEWPWFCIIIKQHKMECYHQDNTPNNRSDPKMRIMLTKTLVALTSKKTTERATFP